MVSFRYSNREVISDLDKVTASAHMEEKVADSKWRRFQRVGRSTKGLPLDPVCEQESR